MIFYFHSLSKTLLHTHSMCDVNFDGQDGQRCIELYVWSWGRRKWTNTTSTIAADCFSVV